MTSFLRWDLSLALILNERKATKFGRQHCHVNSKIVSNVLIYHKSASTFCIFHFY